MKEITPPPLQQPTIVKYTQTHRNGIQVTTLHRHAIGFVQRGKRHVYRGDLRKEIAKGDAYYLGIGNHYIEDLPEGNRPFEQIVFYYDNHQINKILNQLNLNYQLDIQNDHDCPNCQDRSAVGYPAWSSLKHFFDSIGHYLTDDVFERDEAAESLKLMELAYLILSHKDNCLQKCLLNHADISSADFEQIIYGSVFSDLSIEDLAKECNRSLTSFKKEFRKRFNESPHRWSNRQRMMHARLMLISTNKSIAQIGNECNLPNTSHFIKLFKKEYGVTPGAFRKANEKVTV